MKNKTPRRNPSKGRLKKGQGTDLQDDTVGNTGDIIGDNSGDNRASLFDEPFPDLTLGPGGTALLRSPVVSAPPPKPPAAVLEKLRKEVEASLRHFTDRFERFHEAWALADEYESSGQPWGAVLVYRYLLEKEPNAGQTSLFLSDALLLVGELEPALEEVERVYGLEPTCRETQRQMIEILRLLGRDWKAYSWSKMPVVAELNQRTMSRCAEWLQVNGPADFVDFEIELFEGEILLFNEDSLGELLAQHPGIERIDDGLYPVWAEAGAGWQQMFVVNEAESDKGPVH